MALNLTDRIRESILSGETPLPCKGKIVQIGNHSYSIPPSPDQIDIKRITFLKRSYTSPDEKRDSPTPDLERAESLLDYLGSDSLGEYEPHIKFISGLSDSDLIPPPKLLYLDSFYSDNRIIISPLRIKESYSVDLVARYNRLERNREPRQTSPLAALQFQTFVGGLEAPQINDDEQKVSFSYEDEKGVFQTTKRDYATGDSELFINRYPTFFNPLMEGVDRTAFIPFEVLRTLLEPYTSERIVGQLNQLPKSRGFLEKDAEGKREEVHRVVTTALGHEIGISEALTKLWMQRDTSINGLNPDEIIGWSPKTAYVQTSKEVSDSLISQRNIKPREIVNLYCPSNPYRDNWNSFLRQIMKNS